jgi:hypothetical protein
LAPSVDRAERDETRVGPSHEDILVAAYFDGEVFHGLVERPAAANFESVVQLDAKSVPGIMSSTRRPWLASLRLAR